MSGPLSAPARGQPERKARFSLTAFMTVQQELLRRRIEPQNNPTCRPSPDPGPGVARDDDRSNIQGLAECRVPGRGRQVASPPGAALRARARAMGHAPRSWSRGAASRASAEVFLGLQHGSQWREGTCTESTGGPLPSPTHSGLPRLYPHTDRSVESASSSPPMLCAGHNHDASRHWLYSHTTPSYDC